MKMNTVMNLVNRIVYKIVDFLKLVRNKIMFEAVVADVEAFDAEAWHRFCLRVLDETSYLDRRSSREEMILRLIRPLRGDMVEWSDASSESCSESVSSRMSSDEEEELPPEIFQSETQGTVSLYQCKYCHHFCYSNVTHNIHMYNKHKKRFTYHCSHCSLCTDNPNVLRNHLIEIHDKYKIGDCFLPARWFIHWYYDKETKTRMDITFSQHRT